MSDMRTIKEVRRSLQVMQGGATDCYEAVSLAGTVEDLLAIVDAIEQRLSDVERRLATIGIP